MKALLLWMGLLMVHVTCAASVATMKPMSIRIANDDQVKITLSNQDINRLFVANDKITSVNAPTHRLITHNDASGSLFINLMGKAPLTAFITTQQGRHFSLFILPKSEPGITVQLIPQTPAPVHYRHHTGRAQHFEQSTPYEKTLVTLLRDVMLQHTPPGYSSLSPRAFEKITALQVPKYFNGNSRLPEHVVAGYLGGALTVRVLQLTNHSTQTLMLVASDFYQPGVRAVAIVNETVAPHQSDLIYEVTSHA